MIYFNKTMEKILEQFKTLIDARTTFLLVLAFLSWCVNYFYKLSKWDLWSFRMFFINNSMAIFIWYWVSLLLPDTEWEKVAVMWCAFIARDLLWLLEIYWLKFMEKKIQNELNLDDKKIQNKLNLDNNLNPNNEQKWQ